MRFMGTVVSDAGISKKTNQDSACLKVAETKSRGQAALAVMCDGMGGLEKGEIASAYVVQCFSDWFENELPERLAAFSWEDLQREWKVMVTNCNQKLLAYGKEVQVNLGTTLSALFLLGEKYMIIHVGDSRVYKVRGKMEQLTEDQTFVNREISRGTMTAEQAQKDPRRNMLLQCVGASRVVEPDVIMGEAEPDTVFMLCSDGFRHVLSEQEMYEQMKPEQVSDMHKAHENLVSLVELVKSRNEKDNVSVAVIKCTK